MPTRTQIPLPVPTNEYEFENITKDYCQIKYGNAELFGRRGQAQKGIDIYCKLSNKLIGVQCKCYNLLSISNIDEILEKIEEFSSQIDVLIIATTAQRDARVQEYIIDKNQNNKREIILLYWNEISNLLRQHPDILRMHYPDEYCISNDIVSNESDNITEEFIKDNFNKAIQYFSVIPFMKVDIAFGIEKDLPGNVDSFCRIMNNLLEKAILLQKTDTYINIKQFTCSLEKYNGYLSLIMYPANNGFYTMQSESDLLRIDELKKEDLLLKNEINALYAKVNNGLSLF